MSARAGETFDIARAVADIEALLAAPLPAAGPTVAEGEPGTGEWTVTVGEGFRIAPLWESGLLDEADGTGWDEAEEAAEAQLASLVKELEGRWGAHHQVAVHVLLLRQEDGSEMSSLLRQQGEAAPPLFEALLDEDCYGDLAVWGPVSAQGRWVGVSVGRSDGDAPLVMAAVVSDRPIVAPAPPSWM
ncbi:hypothetical protein ACIOEW_20775 [Streptomyces sp. NPDC087901]|uniref:hypothetical protein n=1 Tax=Streptomyces sp. NPDC087901 TaxID=3365818 RepID=UPI003802961A